MSISKKNIAISSDNFIEIEDGFFILQAQNNTSDYQCITQNVNKNIIQFHFCVKGKIKFNFNQGSYDLQTEEDQSLLLYNPTKALPINLEIYPNSWFVSVLVSVKKLHTMFSSQANYIDLLMEENRNKKYYKDGKITPATAVVLSQMLNFNLHSSVKNIYLKGKAYELIGLYFNQPEETNVEQCPFLVDEDNVRKIKLAKEIIIQRMVDPPSLNELADEVGLSLKKLKEGFKEIYGDTVYSFLLDYKMNYARKLLERGQKNVNEIGLSIGYSTASHFIAAFKKKFGTTPKKYAQNQ
ncbi:AraC family transcriptional regulator [Psychroflexus salis]|uniref:AraC family transcriptional regulator n=1 Tax=Psychroflexus salis TaxID=1526574 RepID=A0A917E631_9FLAO|nr:AraC family transcriptional regulator [Psychroflexus salis]GGE08306.1 AraC family transcriptional regulator [Psychroflexus salis]